ncbi:hypothetical protein MCOR25_005011 [Pyricularia grisea]|uniref:GH16 domain-containing protein n=1 Tax=Pyricularia grisea TaxID=148305 RepID=A0A6P8B0H1_PYRGI|nr:uncharacterized protein PgNI_07736 [Pyricularia grisea]KAI6367089.1 hypothetical protein MCOR25_005011 [Pyricularia grisea]TLD08329.1 hypothetical protein PgNI_07736 [Pyricularia grisea]
MSPSLVTLATAFLACASTATAAKAYQIEETYDTSNVNSKWNFFESKFDTGNVRDIDPTEGFVNYRSYNDAKALGVLSEESGSIMMKPNFPTGITAKGKGPDSVRLESKARYQQGLFIADFSRFPKPVCGSWPAFWMFGNSWPEEGELDIYEGWNVQPVNGIALHTDHAAKVGSCHIDAQDVNADVQTTNCDNFFTDIPKQWEGTACLVKERNGLWGNPTGGVYAIEWSSRNVSVWSWAHEKTPADVLDGKPNPRTWGQPHFFVGDSKCDIERVLSNQKIVLNLDFCGVTAGNEGIWGQECKAKTGAATCTEYVAGNPSAFSDVAFGLKNIKVYQNKEIEEPKPTTTAQSTTTTATPSSTSSLSSTTKTTESPSATGITTSPSTTATTTASSTEASTSASSTLTTTTPPSTNQSTTATPAPTSDCEDDEPTGTPTQSTTKTSTMASGTATTKEPEQSITSTITTTKTYVITSCAPTVTKCPLGQVTSEVITTTTVCPVTATGTGSATTVTGSGSTSTITPIGTLTAPTGTATTKQPEQSVTSTITTTKTYTITSCAPTVTKCSIGQVTSEVVTTTTVCPVTATGTGSATTATGSTSTITPIGTPTGTATTKATTKTPEQSVTSTITTTKTYTITSCAPTVTKCPIGQVTSEVITTTTICPPEPTTTLQTTTVHSTLSLTSTVRITRPTSSLSSKSSPPFPSSSAVGSNSTLPASTKTATPTLTRGTATGTGTVIKPTTATTTPSVPVVTAGASGVEAAGLLAFGALFLFAL